MYLRILRTICALQNQLRRDWSGATPKSLMHVNIARFKEATNRRVCRLNTASRILELQR